MPAICFLDVTGYTRLTQELGDDAAAEMVEMLARIVRRSSVQHGGKPIKWLGDGVMFYFTDPGRGVRGALGRARRSSRRRSPTFRSKTASRSIRSVPWS